MAAGRKLGGWAILLGALAASLPPARADTPDTNVVTAASDAFGVAIGIELVGLYSPGQVRGFDPIGAGNARIEGLYFDAHGPLIPYGPIPARLVQDTRIRIGLAASDFPFPSPTGIVDFTLRNPIGTAALSPVYYVGPYGTNGFDLDGHLPFADGHCGVGAGVTRRWDEFVPGVVQHTSDVAAIIACHPSDRLSFGVFYGRTTETDQSIFPVVYLTDQPIFDAYDSHQTAATWERADTVLTDFGGVLRYEFSTVWSLRAGIFRSVYAEPYSGSDLLYDPQPASGLSTSHLFVQYPSQETASTSGELRLTGTLERGSTRHELLFSLRARDVNAWYGGYDQIDLPNEIPGTRIDVPRPTFSFSPLTADHTVQWTAGTAYLAHWKGVGDLAVGLAQVRYQRDIRDPVAGDFSHRETPVLYYATLTRELGTKLNAYAALTRGLEDSGLAPASAANRGQLLPANRSSQEEMGLKYSFSTKSALVAGVFRIEKPYFNTDAGGNYVWLGTERHTGIELSLTAEPFAGLTVLGGALLMDPGVELGPLAGPGVGTAPVSQTRRLLLASIDYHPPRLERWSVDLTLAQQGPVPVRLDDGAYTPSVTQLGVGARYRFPVYGHQATLRLQVQNATGERLWSVTDSSGGLAPYPPRHMALAYVSVDL
jgi:iron complex outermembrane recepter protein